MADLLVVVHHGLCIDRKFCFLVCGDRDETKGIIISKCLLLCPLKWRNLKPGADHGKFLRPKPMAQYLKTLFFTLKKNMLSTVTKQTLMVMENIMLC
jgi:hypothetical protein